ncbi:epsin domain-containing protein [Mycena sanguinolenta]|nr:epsin domain-containing protein [Mycena sanguinolenta]
MQHFGKGAVRVVKNYTKGYSDTQAKVRDATSNDPWGPSGTQMNEIAQMTYNQGDFVEIMEMLDKRLNDKGKNWRHVFKSLTLLDYLLHQGSENVIIYFKDNLYVIKTLKEFQYVDEDGKDQGGNVRAKAKDITSLLQDEGRLRTERRARASMRERMVKGAGEEGEFDENARRRGGGGADDEMRRAIEASKASLRQEQLTKEEQELMQAIKLSEEEEAKRQKLADESNAKALFDDQQQLAPPASNNPFPFLDAPPPQQQQLQPQFTMIQPQFTSFNPYQQQAEMEAEYLRQQQQQAFLAQQQQQQQDEWMRQQMLQQQQQQQQDEWMRQQMMAQQQQQQLVPQPTGFGTNNPFAPQQQQPPPPLPSFSPTMQQPPMFNLQGTYDNNSTPQPSYQPSSPSPPAQAQQPGGPNFKVKVNDGNNQHLADLFANREAGQDTFGNTGILKYGHTSAGRQIVAQQTAAGHNPFARQQQQSEQPFFNV